MNDEIAKDIVTDSVIAQALQAAKSYPDLKILCPCCPVSMIGAEFWEHFKVHSEANLPTPSHWEAL
jgi:hypothetical protein